MYKSHSRHTPGERYSRRQSTIIGLSGALAIALVGCLTPDGTTTGTDASSYSAHSLTIAADSDWSLSSGNGTPMPAASANTSGNVSLAHAEGMGMLEGARPVSTALVELSGATIKLAAIGIAQRPPHPPMGMGAPRPNSMESMDARRQNTGRRGPPPVMQENFAAYIGPLTLDLLGNASASILHDVALADNTNYVAFLIPITAPGTAALHTEGYFENDNTAFTFALDIPLRHPLVVPLFAGEAAQALTAHVRLAAALSRVDLDRCADTANRDAQGAYAITDPSACGLDRALDHLGKPPHPRRRGGAMMEDNPGPETQAPRPTLVCNGAASWCATLPSNGTLPPRESVCITSVEHTAAGITITVQEPGNDCESLVPPQHPHEP